MTEKISQQVGDNSTNATTPENKKERNNTNANSDANTGAISTENASSDNVNADQRHNVINRLRGSRSEQLGSR